MLRFCSLVGRLWRWVSGGGGLFRALLAVALRALFGLFVLLSFVVVPALFALFGAGFLQHRLNYNLLLKESKKRCYTNLHLFIVTK